MRSGLAGAVPPPYLRPTSSIPPPLHCSGFPRATPKTRTRGGGGGVRTERCFPLPIFPSSPAHLPFMLPIPPPRLPSLPPFLPISPLFLPICLYSLPAHLPFMPPIPPPRLPSLPPFLPISSLYSCASAYTPRLRIFPSCCYSPSTPTIFAPFLPISSLFLRIFLSPSACLPPSLPPHRPSIFPPIPTTENCTIYLDTSFATT